MGKALKRIGIGILILVVLPYLGTAAYIYIYSFKDTRERAHFAIVLGAAAWHTRPSPVFKERINHAIDLYKRGQVKKILFTGGRGRGVEDINLSESMVARSYAINAGIPAEDILTEIRSRNTQENLQYAMEAMGPRADERSIIVSDPLHMRRTMTMAEDMGLRVLPSPTPSSRIQSPRNQIKFLVKETRDYLVYLAVTRGAALVEALASAESNRE